MRVGLFVTCLVDLMRPRIGFATLRLLEAAGCEVVIPEGQTCCGQPAFSAGDRIGVGNGCIQPGPAETARPPPGILHLAFM